MDPTAYNFVLLTIDALRYDHCGFNGYERSGVSPFLDEILKKGVVFSNVYSTGPCTPPAFSSIFTATFPFDKGGYSPLPKVKRTIAQLFAKNGYQTAGFHSNPLISHYYKYERGFKKYFDSLQMAATNPIKKKLFGAQTVNGGRWNMLLNKLQDFEFSKVFQTIVKRLFYRLVFGRQQQYYVKARWITKRALKWLNRHVFNDDKDINIEKIKEESKKYKKIIEKHKPFFLWIHYMDTHDPFIPLWKFLKQVGAKIPKKEFELIKTYPEYTDVLKEHDLKNKLVDLYDAEMADVDSRIKAVVDYFKTRKLYDKTIFIVTSDHGEEFNEHGDYGHRAHLYDELVHVPFAIFGGPIENNAFPALKPGSKVDGLFSLIQIPPTLLDMAGIDKPLSFDAVSILDKLIEDNKSLGKAVDMENHVMSCTYHKGITTRFNPMQDPTIKKMVCIRNNTHKYIFDEETGIQELYDLQNDPNEKINIAQSKPEIVKKLEKLGKKYLKGKGYQLENPSVSEGVSVEKQRIISAVSKFKKRF